MNNQCNYRYIHFPKQHWLMHQYVDHHFLKFQLFGPVSNDLEVAGTSMHKSCIQLTMRGSNAVLARTPMYKVTVVFLSSTHAFQKRFY